MLCVNGILKTLTNAIFRDNILKILIHKTKWQKMQNIWLHFRLTEQLNKSCNLDQKISVSQTNFFQVSLETKCRKRLK